MSTVLMSNLDLLLFIDKYKALIDMKEFSELIKINSFQHKCLRTLLKTRFSTLHYICYTYFQQFRVTDEEVVAYSWPTHTADGSDWVGPFVTCFDDALGLSPQPEPNHLSNSTQIRPKSLDCWTISSFYYISYL